MRQIHNSIKYLLAGLSLFAFIACLFGCASSPDKIDAAYVSPLKYRDYDCDQLAIEMDYITHRTVKLYHRLKKEHDNDSAQMGVGLILFWPTLFLLEGGDGPEAAEYAQLKGEFEACRVCSVKKKCDFEYDSPEKIIEREDEIAKAKMEELNEAEQYKGP
jgi:hypothetical protein